jgi:hypothetical protein
MTQEGGVPTTEAGDYTPKNIFLTGGAGKKRNSWGVNGTMTDHHDLMKILIIVEMHC